MGTSTVGTTENCACQQIYGKMAQAASLDKLRLMRPSKNQSGPPTLTVFFAIATDDHPGRVRRVAHQ